MELQQPQRIGSGKPGPGRPRGSKNKLNRDIREIVIAAMQEAGGGGPDGGIRYLTEQARANPRAFLSLVAKLIPRDVKAELRGATLEELVSRSFEIEGNGLQEDAQPVLAR